MADDAHEIYVYGEKSFRVNVALWSAFFLAAVLLGIYTTWWFPLVLMPLLIIGTKFDTLRSRKIVFTPESITITDIVGKHPNPKTFLIADIEEAEIDIVDHNYWFVVDYSYCKFCRTYPLLRLKMKSGIQHSIHMKGLREFERYKFSGQLAKHMNVKGHIPSFWELM